MQIFSCAWIPFLLLSAFARADVHVVDFTGGGDFLSIQPAVAAAQDGDTILVRPGSYPSFEVVDKSLSILSEAGRGFTTGGARVADLAAGRTVALVGFSLLAPSGGLPALLLEDCLGAVRLSDISMLGASSTASAATPGVVVSACADLVLEDCVVTGGAGAGACCTFLAAHALTSLDSQVAIYGSQLRGGPGLPSTATNGGDGLFAQQSFVFASASSIRGGQGADEINGCLDYPGTGGNGVRSNGSEVVLLETLVEAGVGGLDCGCFVSGCWPSGMDGAAFVGSGIELMSGNARELQLPELGVGGSRVVIELRGEPGETGFLLLSRTPGFAYQPLRQGVLALGPPIVFAPQALGTIGASGVLLSQVNLPGIPTVLETLTIHAQGYVLGPQGVRLATPSTVTLLDCTYSSEDCDGNGQLDLCEIVGNPGLDVDGDRVLDACEADCDGNGFPDPIDIASGASDSNGNGILDACESAPRLFVDAAQPSNGADGLSWATAYPDLRDALALAAVSPLAQVEIWVAAATYVPQNALGPDTFEVTSGVSLFGGFAGGETSLGQRDVDANPTILSGATGSPDRNVAFSGVSGARLDGFTITRGQGGGVRVDTSDDVTLAECTFLTNALTSNSTDAGGGGVLVTASEARLTNCTLENNHVAPTAGLGRSGGGLMATDSTLFLDACRFSDNFVQAVSAPSQRGGACYFDQSVVTIVNGLLHDNSGWIGSAIYAFESDTQLVNCTVAENSGARAIQATGFNGTLVVLNSILWDNGATEDAQLFGLGITARRTCIQGLSSFAGSGNLGLDPLFVNAASGDFHLAAGASACIDHGRNDNMPIDTFDVDGDGVTLERWPFDLDGAPRRQDDPNVPDTGVGTSPLVDLGAFE